jgi:hypothetical protein
MMLIMYLGATMPSIPPGVPFGSRSDCQIPERSTRPSGVRGVGAGHHPGVGYIGCVAGQEPFDRDNVVDLHRAAGPARPHQAGQFGLPISMAQFVTMSVSPVTSM